MVVFKDPGNQPTPGLIEEALDEAAPCWTMLTDHFADAGAPVEWRYYREGGWLAKAVGKGQTVGWLSVEDGYVRVTCYFAERHRISLLGDESLAELHPVAARTKTPAPPASPMPSPPGKAPSAGFSTPSNIGRSSVASTS